MPSPSSQIKARAKELLQGEEAKYGFSQEQWIILKAVFEDKEHKEEMHCQNCRMGISCTRCNPQEDE